MRGFFITGTDTHVGKTFVGCALAAAARRSGWTVRALKPIETGCQKVGGGRLVPADAIALAEAAGHPDVGWNDPWFFRHELAAAPAATPSGGLTDLDWLLGAIPPHFEGVDAALVEGAGGLLAPIGPGLLIADLAVSLMLPLLVIAPNRLGVVNHVLLTLEAARARSLFVAAVILNTPAQPVGSPTDVSLSSNAGLIAEHGRVRVLGPCPHVASRDSTAVLQALPALARLWHDPA
ncbi:MAG: dethiobiotin synthase [Deltaproteobacteria bacterium]|nr:dethiobiotin synthase [Deltaproteobacteria bacterium]